MRGLLLSSISVIAVVTVAFVDSSPGQSQDRPPIKIGFSLIGSGGDASYYARQQVKGGQIAVDVANEKGGVNGRKIQVILEDNKADATTGAAVAHKLIDIDKVDALFIEPTPPTLAALPIAEAAQILILSGTQTPKLAESRWGSSASGNAISAGAAEARVAIALKSQRVAVLSEDNDSVAIGVRSFREALQKANVPIVDMETFKSGTTDFTAQMTKIRAATPDLLYLFPAGAQAYGYALKQMGELHFRPKNILTYGQVTDPQVRQLAGNLVDGIYYIRMPIDQQWNDTIFKPRAGYEADTNGAIAYDAIGIYIASRLKAGTDDPAKIRDTMFNYKGYRGAMGEWGFNGTGASQVRFEAVQFHADGTSTKVDF